MSVDSSFQIKHWNILSESFDKRTHKHTLMKQKGGRMSKERSLSKWNTKKRMSQFMHKIMRERVRERVKMRESKEQKQKKHRQHAGDARQRRRRHMLSDWSLSKSMQRKIK